MEFYDRSPRAYHRSQSLSWKPKKTSPVILHLCFIVTEAAFKRANRTNGFQVSDNDLSGTTSQIILYGHNPQLTNCLENFIQRRTAKRLSCGFARFNHPAHAERPHNFIRTGQGARRDAHFLSSSEAQFRTTFTCIALVSLSGSLMQMKCCPSGITP